MKIRSWAQKLHRYEVFRMSGMLRGIELRGTKRQERPPRMRDHVIDILQ